MRRSLETREILGTRILQNRSKISGRTTLAFAGILGVAATFSFAAPPAPGFIRSDADGSGQIDISDSVFLLNFLFLGGPEPECQLAADVDASDSINITDPVYLLNFLFLGGQQPPHPFPDCGDSFGNGTLFCNVFPAECGGGGINEFDLISFAYDTLDTIAGKGEVSTADVNNWRTEFEGGAATSAELSKPHITLGDSEGNLYIADKEAHAIRRVSPEGIITTFAGDGRAGDSGDEPVVATEAFLNEPNGLWITSRDVVYILDTGNDKVRQVSADGMLSTFFAVPGLRTGRGLWVSDDGELAYVASRTQLLRWTPGDGLSAYASGFTQLGNFVVDPRRSDRRDGPRRSLGVSHRLERQSRNHRGQRNDHGRRERRLRP